MRVLTKLGELRRDIIKQVKDFYSDNLLALAIYGSYAKGTVREESDLDIIIILKKAIKGRQRYVEFNQINDQQGLEVNPVIFDIDEAKNFHLIYLSFLEALDIVEDNFGILETIQRKLIGLFEKGIIEKKEIMGITYWRINDDKEVSKRLF